MIEMIRERTLVEEVEYRWEFNYRDEPGSGYSFICDANGIISPDTCGDSVLRCMNGDDLVDCGTVTLEHAYWEPAQGRCTCGAVVDLEFFTNTCDNCEADYNSSGQRLGPRSQWGEETGESLSDILRIR